MMMFRCNLCDASWDVAIESCAQRTMKQPNREISCREVSIQYCLMWLSVNNSLEDGEEEFW